MEDPFPSERYMSLATFRRSGDAVATPVWFAWDDGRLWVFTAGGSGKVKRLRNSPRARVAACNARGRVHGPWLDAETRIVDDPAAKARAYALLSEKYGWQKWLGDLFSRLSGRIHQRRVLEVRPTGGGIDASPAQTG
jgi:hypothetical protein